MSEAAFESGGERNVFRLRFPGHPQLAGEWVGKENKHIERNESKEVEFHRKNLVVQTVANKWAKKFNNEVEERPLSKSVYRMRLPSIKVCECYLFKLPTGRLLFVEPFLEGKFTKWNSNFGSVNKGAMGGIDEDDEDDYGDDYMRPKIDDVPQAFSHFTHHHSKKGRLVCDIQGVFSRNKFRLTDPVVHSNEGEKAKFGRTDRGQHGIVDFFKSHKCNGLCKCLGLPHNYEFDERARAALESNSSINTSQYSVVKTNHLAQRQDQRVIPTRELQSAVKRGDKIPQRDGRVLHRGSDIDYITDMTGRIGITSYRREKFCADARGSRVGRY